MSGTVDFGPVACDIKVTRGDSPIIPITVQTSDGTVIDVTGSTSVLTVDPSEEPTDDTNNLFSVAGSVVDGPNGRIDFQPTEANLDLDNTSRFYDVEVLLSTGERRTVLKGEFIVDPDISK